MFSGIIEATASIIDTQQEKNNVHFTLSNPFGSEVYIDQSIAHNGVCLTLVEIAADGKWYKVTAVKETMDKTNLGMWSKGDLINLERCIKADARMDGHFVQGHVDTTTNCVGIDDEGGSWRYTFGLPENYKHLIVDKGSIAVNGTSLTAILDNTRPDIFQVAIIPYTFQHTNFHTLKAGDQVNLEFDILGKYLDRFRAVHFK